MERPPPNANNPNAQAAAAATPGGGAYGAPPLPHGYQPSPQLGVGGQIPPQVHQPAAYYYHHAHPAGQHQHPGYHGQGYATAVSYQNYANYPPPPGLAGAGGAPRRSPVGGAPPPQGHLPGHPQGLRQYHPHAYQQYDASVYQYIPHAPGQQQAEAMAALYEPTPVRAQPPQQPAQPQFQQQVEKQPLPTAPPALKPAAQQQPQLEKQSEPVPVQPVVEDATDPAPKESVNEPAVAEKGKDEEMPAPEPAPAKDAETPAKETTTDAKDPQEDKQTEEKQEQQKQQIEEATDALTAAPAASEPTAKIAAEETTMDYPMKKAAESPTKQSANYADDDIFPFESVLSHLQDYQKENGNVPVSHPAYSKVMTSLVAAGVEEATSKLWEENFQKLQAYKEKNRDCDVPFTDDPLGKWVERQRKLYAEHQQSTSETNDAAESAARLAGRFARLSALGFDFSTPAWDRRLQELMAYQKEHGHCSPPVTVPKLGIWCVTQRFNLRDMPKERVAALDGIGFVWNHNRKRSHTAWEKRYNELLEFIKENGHCNVPATHRHSKLGSWVGKQREEYKKMLDKKSSQLDKYRIDKLNDVKFQWTLQNYAKVSWDDRFEALKQFKEQHGHCFIPRNHQQFGSWPAYQKSQFKLYKEGKKSKLTKEKADKLIEIGFLEEMPKASNNLPPFTDV